MQVEVFGPTRVSTDDGVLLVGEFGGVKPRQILEILALSAGAPVPKELLADLLWSGRPPRSYVGTLESYVCLLRRALRTGGRTDPGVVTVPQGYVLDDQVLGVDLSGFRALVRAAQRERDARPCLDHLERALDLVSGDLLADEAYAPWAVAEREAYEREIVFVETTAASCALALGEPDRALLHARSALQHDRLAEGAWRTLMRALAATGRRCEGLRAYFELRDHLSGALGVDPSRETTDVYLDLLREESPAQEADGRREEVRLLMGLLREAVMAVSGLDAGRAGGTWMQRAEELAAMGSQACPRTSPR